MRSNIPMYAALEEPLERRKTRILKENKRASPSKTGRTQWATKIPMDTPTVEERWSFEGLKEALSKHTIVHFHDPHKILCLDFDVVRHGIGVAVYHIAEETLPKLTKDGKLMISSPCSCCLNRRCVCRQIH
ncbi:hypothetical protein F4677DRAFT_380882 [Hypoxylon crocopeplum]|nr:hypothetical protein F4677DRAFT_380882 [Hypoxylon crocopeplum]